MSVQRNHRQEGRHDPGLRRGRAGDPRDGHRGGAVRRRAAASQTTRARTATRRSSSGSSRSAQGQARHQADEGPLREGGPAALPRAPRVQRRGRGRGRRWATRSSRRASSRRATRSTIIGMSKGKGFQGVVKRHHFRAAPPPTARCSTARPARSALRPSRRASSRACGRGGPHGRRTASPCKNLKVVRVDAENNTLVVEGLRARRRPAATSSSTRRE